MNDKQIARLCADIINRKLKERNDSEIAQLTSYVNNYLSYMSELRCRVNALHEELLYIKRVLQIK